MNESPISDDEVLAAIYHGKHGVAPGLSGFSREFYQYFSKDLIGFIMNYIKYTEEIGILSNNQRIGVITLLPKGQKDKKSLKNLASDYIAFHSIQDNFRGELMEIIAAIFFIHEIVNLFCRESYEYKKYLVHIPKPVHHEK